MDRIEKELNLLRRISSMLFAAPPRISLEVPEANSVLDNLVSELASAMESDAATIFLRDDANGKNSGSSSFIVRATIGLNRQCIGVTRIKPYEGLAGAAVAERRIIFVPDGPKDPRFVLKSETNEEQYHGFLAAPIIRGEDSIGILVLHFKEVHSATPDEIRMIAALAEQLGFAIENARLYTELEERMGARTALYELMRKLSGILDSNQAFYEITKSVRMLFSSHAAVLRLIDGTTNKLVPQSISGDGIEKNLHIEPCDVESKNCSAAKEVTTMIVNKDGSFSGKDCYPGAANYMSAPMVFKSHVIGMLEVIGKHSKESGRMIPYTETDAKLLTVLAQIAAETYSKSELYMEMESVALTFKRKNHEMMILNRISREIQGSSSVEEILAVILTGITAGYGLGYNRAMILLMDTEKHELVGTMGIGPGIEEVNRVWTEAPEKLKSLDDYLTFADVEKIIKSPFNQIVGSIRIPITGEPSLLCRVLAERKSFNVRSASTLLGSDRVFAQMWKTSAFAIVPVCTKDLALGLIAVDNIFNQRVIQDEELVLLQTIANQCGLALDGARMVLELNNAMKRLDKVTGRLLETERLAVIGEMAAGIAHDIRNPLTAIGGFSRRMANRLPPEDVGRKYAGIIEAEVDRLEKLCADILQLASRKEVNKSNLNAVEVVKNWKIRNETRLRRKKVNFQIETEFLEVNVDPMLYDQAISNILENSLDAIETGGLIRCSGYSDSEYSYLVIQDNGCGMTAEQIEKVFEAFYTTKTEGTGLGLAIARKSISAHKGEIGIDSKPGKGTKITVSVPRL